jgi:hypothetical protein
MLTRFMLAGWGKRAAAYQTSLDHNGNGMTTYTEMALHTDARAYLAMSSTVMVPGG